MQKPGLKGIELFSYSTQLCMKFILLSNVKMQRIVDILTLIGSINNWLWSFKPEISAYFGYFCFYERY